MSAPSIRVTLIAAGPAFADRPVAPNAVAKTCALDRRAPRHAAKVEALCTMEQTVTPSVLSMRVSSEWNRMADKSLVE